MIFLWIIILVVIGVTIWYFWKKGRVFSPSKKQKPPREILERRYAEGEISQEEFEEKMSKLQG